jgi:protein O-GlcNAc transferase
VRLPDCFMISDESVGESAPALRAAHDLPEKGFVFVNFNQNSRIDGGVWQVWMEILGAVPRSVLWLKFSNDLDCANLRTATAARGIEPLWIVFAPDLHDKSARVARLQLADLGLDAFGRYNGHTPNAETLWAGVPVVTTPSERFPGRVATCLLSPAGVAECVTADVEGYKAFSIHYAKDAAERQAVRDALTNARRDAACFHPEGVTCAATGLRGNVGAVRKQSAASPDRTLCLLAYSRHQ